MCECQNQISSCPSCNPVFPTSQCRECLCWCHRLWSEGHLGFPIILLTSKKHHGSKQAQCDTDNNKVLDGMQGRCWLQSRAWHSPTGQKKWKARQKRERTAGTLLYLPTAGDCTLSIQRWLDCCSLLKAIHVVCTRLVPLANLLSM